MIPWIRSTLKLVVTWGAFSVVCLFLLYAVMDRDLFIHLAAPLAIFGILLILIADYRAAK